MRKLYRSMLWSGLVVAGVAACGDNVTVTPPPPPPPPTVQSVSVAPTGVTLVAGSTLQMVATVQADAGVATTVTWTSSDATRATVNASGLVSSPAAAAAGSVAITACSTVVTSKCGSATVTISGQTPATLSIGNITNTVFGTGEVPVNVNAVAAQINVQLNLDAGTQNVAGVDVLIDGKVVASQNFSAVQWEELVAKLAGLRSDPALANSLVQIILSVNTAAFNPPVGAAICPGGTPSAAGAACFLNGPRLLTARARLAGGLTPVATPSISLNFVNANFVAIVASVVPGGSASDTQGRLWQTGDLTATATPVIYTAGSPVINQVVLTPTGGLASKTLTTAPFTATWAKATAVVSGGAGSGSGGIEIFGLTVGANSTVGGATGPAGTSAALNFDTKAPGAPTFVANPNNRQNGWINGPPAPNAVGLAGLNSGATSNNWLLNGALDLACPGTPLLGTPCGVGGYTRMLRIGDGTAGTVNAANAATGSATPTLPVPTVNNNDQCAVATATDLLGNETSLPLAGSTCLSPPFGTFVSTGSQSLRFGVDINAPTIAFSGSLATNARINTATVGGQFSVTVADVGLVGNSGMLGGAPVIGNVQFRTAAATTCGGPGIPAGTPLPGALVSGVCINNNTGIAGALPIQATTGVADETSAAYFTGTLLGQDAAGNQSPTVSNVVVRDNLPVTATNPAVPVTITGAFTASSFLNDDLSIRDYFWTAGFTTGLVSVTTLTLASAPTAVDAFNAATLTNTNFAINTSVNTFLGLQGSPGNVPAAYVAGSNPLSSVNLFARDQTQAAYTGPATSPVAPTAPATGIAISNVTPAWTFNTYTPATSNATICAGQTGAPACGVTPTSTTLSVAASGTTATFPNPFSRVDFYAVNAAGTNLVLVGSVLAGSATLVDNGATRVFTYSLSVTALTFYTTLGGVVPAVIGPVNVYAFGVNAAGNVALVSLAVAQTINP